jgi:hypothetical protein
MLLLIGHFGTALGADGRWGREEKRREKCSFLLKVEN